MLSLIRLYIRGELAKGAEVELEDKQLHYLSHVMRRTINDELVLFNGYNGEWRGRLKVLSKKSGIVEVLELLRPQEQETDLWLVFALLKRGPTDFLTEKASELGVSRLCPLITRRTNSMRVNLERLELIAIEAAEQCGRLTVPEIDKPKTLDNLLANWPEGRGLILLDETGSGKSIAEVMSVRSKLTSDAIMIGPEGGFEPSELTNMRDVPFVTATSLGDRLIRAETAAIAAVSTWHALTGDWTKKQHNSCE